MTDSGYVSFSQSPSLNYRESRNTENADRLFGRKAAQLLGMSESTRSLPGAETDTESQKRATESFQLSRGGSMFGSVFKLAQLQSSSGKVPIQHSGYLYKKSFYGKNVLGARWLKRFFVVKDGALLWYRKKLQDPYNFSTHPSGFIPLGGCQVHPEGKEGNSFLFGINVQNKQLTLKCDDDLQASDWIRVLTNCSKATFDNAQLGEAQMLVLKSKGSVEENATKKFLEAAKEKAQLALELTEERQKIMEHQMKEKRKFQRKIKQEEKETRAESLALVKKREELSAKQKQLKEDEREKRELEAKLLAAKRAVEQLQLAVLEKKGPKKMDLLSDLQELRMFLKNDTDL